MRSIKRWAAARPVQKDLPFPTLVALLNMILRRFFGLAN